MRSEANQLSELYTSQALSTLSESKVLGPCHWKSSTLNIHDLLRLQLKLLLLPHRLQLQLLQMALLVE